MSVLSCSGPSQTKATWLPSGEKPGKDWRPGYVVSGTAIRPDGPGSRRARVTDIQTPIETAITNASLPKTPKTGCRRTDVDATGFKPAGKSDEVSVIGLEA